MSNLVGNPKERFSNDMALMFQSAKDSQKKAVFILSSLLEGVTREILHDVIEASQLQYVVVVTATSTAVHNFSRSGIAETDPGFLEQVEERLLEWMGNMVCKYVNMPMPYTCTVIFMAVKI